MKIFVHIFILFILSFYVCSAEAKSGVESIIENDMQNSGSIYSPDDASTWMNDYSYDPNTTNGNVDVTLSFSNMKAAVGDTLGVPEANYLILILFSLAALLQMARVMGGSGDWVSFSVRVLVILAFLRSYSVLFDGVEVFFTYLADHVLSGESAFTTFWSKQQEIFYTLKGYVNSNQSIWNIDFLKDGLYFTLTTLTSIVAYAFYVLIFLVQSCVIITLRYLGPIIISLAIIPETDFSSGYINTTVQTFSWSVVAAILIKIMNTMTEFGFTTQLNTQDLITISAMNVCYAVAFLFIPIITGMIFTGRGLGGLGVAMTSLGGGFMMGASSFIKQQTYGRAKNGAIRMGSWAAKKSTSVVRNVAGSSVKMASKSIGSIVTSSVKPHVSYAVDHQRRITPAGRAQSNEVKGDQKRGG